MFYSPPVLFMDPLKIPAAQPETKLHFLDYWRIIRIRKTVILAVFLLVVITATLVTFILPVSYASTARIKVDRDVSDIRGLVESAYNPGYDPYFVQTEFEVIQSEFGGRAFRDEPADVQDAASPPPPNAGGYL